MKRRVLLFAVLFFDLHHLLAEPTPAATGAFDAYARTLEARLADQHRSAPTFLAGPANAHPATPQIDHITTTTLDGALLHHWRGTAFVAGAHASDFARLLHDFSAYPQVFAPEVLTASSHAGTATNPGAPSSPTASSSAKVGLQDASLTASMRVRQHHVLTVVMDTDYDVRFGQLDPAHGYSISRSTRIAEIADPGTSREHALSAADEHGFLYRLNTYWSWEERDGGLYLQIESISLSRGIPRGLGWAVAPYVESIPRESLEFTLRSAMKALRRKQ